MSRVGDGDAHEDPASTQQTIVSERKRGRLEDRLAAMRRLYTVGLVGWPVFILPDLLPMLITGDRAHLSWLFAWRSLGEAIGLAGFVAFRYAGDKLTHALITAIDAAVFVLGSIFLGLMALKFGGIASNLQIGVLIFVVARCVLVPEPWRRGSWIPLAQVLAFPLTLLVASNFDPELAAQWSSRPMLAAFAHDFLFVMGGSAVGVIGGQMIHTAKHQLVQARKLGNYQLKLRIGGGGMGEVWLARQMSLGRDVALKVMRDQSARSPEALKRFEREARASSRLSHKNTIRIFDFGATDDGILFIAMELLEGLDLDDMVRASGPLPASRVIFLARQACGSLAEAHARGILHRDIKPANLFVAKMGTEADVIKLLDFGVARMTESLTIPKLTATGKLTGTPAYMSPEICGGDRNIDARADVYSFGAVMYFMLTGGELFPKRTFGEVVMMQISKMPPMPSERLGVPVPRDLESIVMKCLAKEPSQRFASVTEIDAALAECADAGGWTQDDAQEWWDRTRGSATFRVAG